MPVLIATGIILSGFVFLKTFEGFSLIEEELEELIVTTLIQIHFMGLYKKLFGGVYKWSV